ncbi:hypothetical protein HMPREF9735_02384 [Treponema denticola ATCC 33521]|nr:hypothetical protein HMPREF9735_02384 [Treponema denticola ATCC 33521]
MLLCVRFTVRKFVFSCEFVWAERKFMPLCCLLLVACCLLLVACCLLLVACCLLLVAKNCVRHTAACQVLCFTFIRFLVRMVVAAVGAFQAFFYHYLHYSPFLCGFQCFFLNIRASCCVASKKNNPRRISTARMAVAPSKIEFALRTRS